MLATMSVPSSYPITDNAALYDAAQVEEYLMTLFRNVEWNDGEVISLLGIGEKGTPKEGEFRERQLIAPAFMGMTHKHLRRWAEHHVAGFVVPAVLFKTAMEKGDVTLDKVAALTAIILDLDCGDTEAKRTYVTAALGAPSMVIASGGITDKGTPKLHLYWLFNEPSEEVERVAAIRKELAAKVGGDQAFGRVTQVVRVAGTVHAKNGKPSVCRIIDRSSMEYDLDELADIIAAMLPMPGLEPRKAKESPLSAMTAGGLMDFTPPQGTAVAALNRDVHEGGDELNRWGEFSKVAGFNIAEARAGRLTLDQAYSNTYGWMLAHMIPPWPQGRFDQEYRGLLNRDVRTHGPIPQRQAEACTDWPDPLPLPNGLAPVAAFDPMMLPAPLRDWTTDIAERMQAPAEFIAVAAMVAAGSLAGRKVGIRPQQFTDWYEVPNLWGCIIGRPGVMKSPSMKQALAPLQRLENQAREDHARRLTEFQSQEVERELRAKFKKAAIEKRLKVDLDANLSDLLIADEEEPRATRYIVNDGGYQALSEVLRNCAPNGILAYRDELMSLLRSLDDESRVEDRGFYLTGWNGTDSYTSDRIGRGFNLHIPAVTISLLGSTQPGKIVSYIADAIAGGAGDDGLIQRFGMLVWPDLSSDWREVDREPCRIARAAAFKAFERIAKLTPEQVGAEVDEYHPERAFLRFDQEAQQEFQSWRKNLEGRLRSDDLHPAVESHLAKYRKLVPTLALLHHLLSGGHGPVPSPSLLAACAWGEFLETHAQRLYGAAMDRATSNARMILRHINKGNLGPTFSLREVHQKGWTGLTETTAVRAAAERLEANHFIRIERKQNPKGGRASEVCTVNPKVLSQ